MRSHKSAQGPSQRQLRVGEQIRHILGEYLQRGHFHAPGVMEINPAEISITEVRISPDLKNATAYVSSLGGKDIDGVLEALNDQSKEFQKEINRQTNLKFTPRIRFINDKSFDEAGRIEELLSEINNKKN